MGSVIPITTLIQRYCECVVPRGDSVSPLLPPSLQMVQCGACDSWVHSQCEGMSGKSLYHPTPSHTHYRASLFADDWYEILSILPEESVEFLCRLCGSEEKRKAWQDEVEQYLQESMTKVLSPFLLLLSPS